MHLKTLLSVSKPLLSVNQSSIKCINDPKKLKERLVRTNEKFETSSNFVFGGMFVSSHKYKNEWWAF